MIYLVLSFFITFSAHSRGHDHGRPDYTVKVSLDSLKEKQNEIIDNVKSNRKTLSEIAPAVDHNRKTLNAILEKLNSDNNIGKEDNERRNFAINEKRCDDFIHTLGQACPDSPLCAESGYALERLKNNILNYEHKAKEVRKARGSTGQR